MRMVDRSSFKNGDNEIKKRRGGLQIEIEEVIKAVDAKLHRAKSSKEKTKRGWTLYSSRA